MTHPPQVQKDPGKKMQDILSSPEKDISPPEKDISPPETDISLPETDIVEEVKPGEDIFANIPRKTEKPELPSRASSLRKKPSRREASSRWENALRALWTSASVISMLINIVVIALLILLYQNYSVMQVPPEIDTNTPKDLLKGLYDNFELMDEAHIETMIVVEDQIPVKFDLDLNQITNVVLSEAVTIDGARVTLTTGGLNIYNAPATVILPKGTILPIVLNIKVPVDEMIDITLNVPVDIPLEETDLHIPFTGLQEVVTPLYCLASPNALSISGEAICP